ncbi:MULTISPECIES: flagellar basal body L-ring protein FlgH [Limnochorda]|uniref:flagellar basal body L-ring protein FlgH n=1 Tax=Limnochorda TaxID=1676651 RepID=UPI00181EA321|nr:flagellar basal body L-ring protein FlgH [Limnochorda pilosa]MBO2485773.1 flagellar biosynthesis protein FlgH [Bacillota bacterium]MBO2519288.1 flagellar biosynthesis protein FlgH [Bacillota bacterium]NMA70923.1 flagellar basal body L-ring protein FlgH [Bacillota bacterium]
MRDGGSLKRRRRVQALLIAASVLLAGVGWAPRAAAQSLWPVEGAPSLFADRKASRTGDLVTLVIQEWTEGRQSAVTSTSSDHQTSLSPASVLTQWIPGLSLSASQSGEGNGSTRRGSSLEARLTARVVEVTPEGNLRIEGSREIVINGDKQRLTITGLVRPEDISANNTVLSSYLADARIELDGEGPVGDLQDPGLLTRLFNWLF